MRVECPWPLKLMREAPTNTTESSDMVVGSAGSGTGSEWTRQCDLMSSLSRDRSSAQSRRALSIARDSRRGLTGRDEVETRVNRGLRCPLAEMTASLPETAHLDPSALAQSLIARLDAL